MSVIIAQGDAVTAYGWGMDALWCGLRSGTTAIRPSPRFDRPGFVSCQAAQIDGLAVEPGESRVMAMLRKLLSPLAGTIDSRTTLILSTTIGEVDFIERAVLDDCAEDESQAGPDRLLMRIKRLLGLNGDAAVVSSACASSAIALTRAAAMIQQGLAEQVLVVACDALTEFLYAGFSGLLSLSEQPARPFDADRDGLSLGEAAAWALLTVDSHRAAIDQRLACRVIGWGNTCDAVHMTAPDRAGNGLIRAINKACRMAQADPADIGFVVAHGTATALSDAMEIGALCQTMPRPVPVMSIKGGIGHTCAATGLIQILLAGRALHETSLPATIGLTTPDAACDSRYIQRAVDVAGDAAALSMNSGFGGVNSVVMLKGIGQ